MVFIGVSLAERRRLAIACRWAYGVVDSESGMAEFNQSMWAPWRMEYIRSMVGKGEAGCFLCRYAEHPEEDAVSRAVTRYITELRHVKPEIDGDTLIKAGYVPGRGFKDALDEVRRAKLDGEIRGKDSEVELAKKVLGGK